MKQLASKFLVSLACAIIMVHAMVPHHHHDCNEVGGFVFESEMACHCNDTCPHHDHHNHSHHPFDICLLQEMLSHLILTTNDDQHALLSFLKAEGTHGLFLFFPNAVISLQPLLPVDVGTPHFPPLAARLVQAPKLGAHSLRAPPLLG